MCCLLKYTIQVKVKSPFCILKNVKFVVYFNRYMHCCEHDVLDFFKHCQNDWKTKSDNLSTLRGWGVKGCLNFFKSSEVHFFLSFIFLIREACRASLTESDLNVLTLKIVHKHQNHTSSAVLGSKSFLYLILILVSSHFTFPLKGAPCCVPLFIICFLEKAFFY